MTSHQNRLISLAKFLTYILGRCPDEFGLVPDVDGYFNIKDLLKVFSEEPGWGFVRLSHLQGIIVSVQNPPVEITGNRIRAVVRDQLTPRRIAVELPKLLYTCVRKRAYPHVVENGIQPAGQNEIILSADPNMSKRIGKRADMRAILLTVQVLACQRLGVVFFNAGEGIYTAAWIPAGGFTGPVLPREPDVEKGKGSRELQPKEPGSFLVNLNNSGDRGGLDHSRFEKGKTPGLNKGRKRKDRFDRERPPWRR